jgi:hypothetical protein
MNRHIAKANDIGSGRPRGKKEVQTDRYWVVQKFVY